METDKTQIISFRDVTVREGNTTILDNITFDIDVHEKIAIVVPIGSGKRTLFKFM